MSKPKSKRFVAGGNPAFDERAPEVQKKQAFVGGNPLFDERKVVQAVKKIAEISREKKDEV
jgi:hypothetical protein